jgi:hypothetical protein
MTKTRTVLAAILFIALTGAAGAATHHAASPIQPNFTLVIDFTGLVDVISDGSSNPGKVWIVLPDVSDLETLKLSETLKGTYPMWTIAKHQAMLFGDSLPFAAIPCSSDDLAAALKIHGYQIEFIGDFLEPGLTVERSRLPGNIPCDPSDSTCPETRPIVLQERSLNWLPKIDDILPYGPPLRKRLLDDGGGVLASIFSFTAGRVFSSGLWKKAGGDYSTIEFPGVPGYRWKSPRGVAAGVSVILQVLGRDMTIRLRDLGTGVVTDRTLVPGANAVVHLTVENQPLGNQIPEDGTPRVCLGRDHDFTAHYVLRQYSEELDGPVLAIYNPGPGVDPQCSPGDNVGP